METGDLRKPSSGMRQAEKSENNPAVTNSYNNKQ